MTVADRPSDESSLRPTDHLFKAVRRQMVAFIDDHLPVLGDAIVHDIFADEALNDRHIEQPGRLVAAAANSADRLGREVQKRRQTLDPLVQELAPMHEHQRIDAALGDQPGSDDRLAERRRGGQDTSLVLQHRLGGELLLRQRDEIAESSLRQRVLIRKETVVPSRVRCPVDAPSSP